MTLVKRSVTVSYPNAAGALLHHQFEDRDPVQLDSAAPLTTSHNETSPLPIMMTVDTHNMGQYIQLAVKVCDAATGDLIKIDNEYIPIVSASNPDAHTEWLEIPESAESATETHHYIHQSASTLQHVFPSGHALRFKLTELPPSHPMYNVNGTVQPLRIEVDTWLRQKDMFTTSQELKHSVGTDMKSYESKLDSLIGVVYEPFDLETNTMKQQHISFTPNTTAIRTYL